MRPMRIALVWASVFFTGAPPADAQPAPAAAAPDARLSEEAKQQRFEFLLKTFKSYSLSAAVGGERPFSHREEPLVHFNNPVRQAFSDAVLFLWLDGERPRAAATIAIRSKGQVSREFTSLSSEPLECRGDAGERWSPKSAGLPEQDLPEAPAPKGAENLRLIQMKQLARRFRVVMKEPATDEQSELRLMERPIYRFAAEQADIIDGALFAFAEGTDPEALLLLEAVKGAGGSQSWRYTLARMTARPLDAELDGRKTWSVLGFWSNPRSPSDPYIEMIRGTYPLMP